MRNSVDRCGNIAKIRLESCGAEGTVYTDDATVYEAFPFARDTVKHSLQEYVRDDVHTNDIESL